MPDIKFTPSIVIDSQECLAGHLVIEAGHIGEPGAEAVVVLSVERSGQATLVYLSERHVRELATTLLAIASKLDEGPAEPNGD